MKIINILTSFSIFSLSFTSPILANQIYRYSISNRLTCSETISAVQDQFGNASIKPVDSSYIKYLKGRNMVAIVIISGKGNNASKAQKLLSSSKLLKTSQEIYRNCPKVGMVEFVIDGIDDNVTYGIVNGRMKEFTCAKKPPVKWGEHICT
jgi:hypothetical protein